MAETERENIREVTLEGLNAAARKGDHGGCSAVVTGVHPAQSDHSQRRRKGQNPILASTYRALAERKAPSGQSAKAWGA